MEKPAHVKNFGKSLNSVSGSNIFSLNAAASVKVSYCRQHWLRFSWDDTWIAQELAGITQDTTLMFNDRPGFRNSSVINWTPWSTKNKSSHNLKAMPSIIMDSHFYDYQINDIFKTNLSMNRLINECQFVNGEAAVLWHPHTLTKDYGWSQGFKNLLDIMKK